MAITDYLDLEVGDDFSQPHIGVVRGRVIEITHDEHNCPVVCVVRNFDGLFYTLDLELCEPGRGRLH